MMAYDIAGSQRAFGFIELLLPYGMRLTAVPRWAYYVGVGCRRDLFSPLADH